MSAETTGNAGTVEDPVLPDLPIVDAHIHLWHRDNYLAQDFLKDAASGHNVQASVYVECGMSYSDDTDPALRPVGETRYVLDQVGQTTDVPHRLAAGILGAADMSLGDGVKPVLEAHEAAGQGRFRGLRSRIAWSDDPVASYKEEGPPNFNAIGDDRFVEAARCLMDKELVLDLWGFHTQLEDIAHFASLVPDLTIVLDHVGGPLGVGRFAGRRDEVFREWKAGMRKVAQLPNVHVKVSGLGIARLGFGYQTNGQVKSSDELAAAWAPYVRTSTELFGPERTIFASNYPVDRAAAPYVTLINGFKKMLSDLSADEMHAVFAGNARRVYRLD